MLIGYARVSTTDQDLTLQIDALTKAGCERLFTDKASGATTDRPGLTEALHFARAGDTLIIWKLDRLGRSIRGLIELAAGLAARKVDFRSLTDGFDRHPFRSAPVPYPRLGCRDGERVDKRAHDRRFGSSSGEGRNGWGPQTSDDGREDRHRDPARGYRSRSLPFGIEFWE